ncbi:type VI secretion system Vgr family protein [Burkholderia ubonensis]|uniref:type VI secretion system Vgr family protein n=1 Tax=Burkholderia ubonensis TaxID=101571 RepID=UPI001E607C9A|nr:type VI secretion system Vgr family protein [Burkholderia ubonensis]
MGDAQYNRLVKLDTSLGVDWLLPIFVKGTARLGRDYEFVIDAVSARGGEIELTALLGKAVTLWIQQLDGAYMPIHGYVHRFSRLGADGPLTYYQLRFSSWLYFLRLRRDMRDWQEQNGEQILTDVFNEHPLARGAFRFNLYRQLPSYSNRVQWEYDINFVHRSLEESGVFPYFEQAANGRSHQMVLTDDSYSLPELRQPVVQFGRMGIGEELDGFTQWTEQLQIESAELTTRSFDYKRPDLPREIQGATDEYGKLPTSGEVYDYPGAYAWSTGEQGERLARIRLEERMSRMKRFHGVGALRCAMPGYRFELSGHPVHDAGDKGDREFVLLGVDWLIRNNLPGMAGVAEFPESVAAEVAQAGAGAKVSHPDGSEGFFQVSVQAQRRNVPFRSPFEHRKPVMQLQNAIIAGPDGEEVYTDALNRVKVWFHWNRRNGQTERASIWVRPTFLDAGSQRGGIHPLRKGDEVVVGFMEGDCDRPVIIARMYGGATQPVWHTNGLLSGYRSKEYGGSGYNQLVMDDATGQNRVHLYSSSYRSHLHLGYLVQHTDNTRGAFLGSGFDLKSDAHGAIRAEQGLYISTHPTSEVQPLNAQAASEQLINAESVIEAVSDASVAAQAEGMRTGRDALRSFTDATRHSVSGATAAGGRTAGGGTGNASGFSKPVMLMAGRSGVAISTPQSTHVSADQHVNIVSGQNTHLATGKSFVLSAVEKLSLFVQKAGIKMFAASGKVDIQAQRDDMALGAMKDVTIRSNDGQLALFAAKDVKVSSTQGQTTIASQQGVTLMSGGAYIKISNGNIELGCPGAITLKSANFHWEGPAQLQDSEKLWPGHIPANFSSKVFLDKQLQERMSAAGPIPYQVVTESGTVLAKGALDALGATQRVFHGNTEALNVLLGEKGEWLVAPHTDDDCGCGGHEDELAPGIAGLAERQPSADHADEAGDEGRPLQSALSGGAGASLPEESAAFQRSLIEHLVFGDPEIRKAISEGEE